MSNPAGWIVFGDDWGKHPTTTQHLLSHMPPEDRIIWINSIGSRTPGLNMRDLRRITGRIGEMAAAKIRPASPGLPASSSPDRQAHGHDDNDHEKTGPEEKKRLTVINPPIIPFHLNPLARRANNFMLARKIGPLAQAMKCEKFNLIASNPVAVSYIDGLPASRVIYLRLDDYEKLPGCEPGLIRWSEDKMFQRADLIVATARELLPSGPFAAKGRYLPQGVHFEHFAQAPLTPPGRKIMGFFGLMEKWLDHRLICALAKLRPDWTFRFIGRQQYVHPSLASHPNIELLPPVPFSQLPFITAEWAAAWIPFEVSEMTRAVNPLKLREYLAIGLPTHSTPMPEVMAFAPKSGILISTDPQAISDWLDNVLETDSEKARRKRREGVRGDGWEQRSRQLRQMAVEN